jgi:hypothetical protein
MVENVIAPIIRKGEVNFLALDTAVGTGLDATNRFVLPQDHSVSMTNVTFQSKGTFTVLDCDIEVSLDGGQTFAVIGSIDFAATPAARNDVGRTGIYRLNVTAFTGTDASVVVGIP